MSLTPNQLRHELELIDKALISKPDHIEAWIKRGELLFLLGQSQEAITAFDKALSLNPNAAAAHNNRAHVLQTFGKLEEALAGFDAAILAKPDYVLAYNNRATVLQQLKRWNEALDAFAKAVELKPDFAEAWVSYGDLLLQSNRHANAIAAFRRAVDLAPEANFAMGFLLHAKMRACDWAGAPELMASVTAGLRAGHHVAEPFGFQALTASEAEMKACAEITAAARFPAQPASFPVSPPHGKIRIGYVGAEFRVHAMAILLTDMYECHDKTRFEIYAFDNGFDDGSDYRARINRAFTEVVDISRMGDMDAALAVHERGIDILVDLNGYFGPGRQGVFALRPAPIQVNYLGNPSTLGAAFMDYLIADATVIPEASRIHYTEKIAYLPDCYQPNDRKRKIADTVFARAELGLPEDAFVFCCFNNNYKITPATFDGWMRILKRTQNGVLWLLADNDTAERNLRREAEARGVDAARLVFGPRLPPDLHLARHCAADLFLDTLPYNAHTTASDALWTGLPVLTCAGSTFPGRVASSLLKAVGLPELITTTQNDYENRAFELATQREYLTQIKRKLVQARTAAPLFDTPTFTKNIENLYTRMIQRHQQGLPPANIDERENR